MYSVEFKGINSFLVGASKLLLQEGVKRNTRGEVCYELPAPIIIKISNPCARIVTIPERKWNLTLPYAESLWIASGRNDIALIKHYLKKMLNYSDDHLFMRAGYGPRLRFHNGIKNDYEIGFTSHEIRQEGVEVVEVDQFKFIEKIFERDPNTRQAIISINDPAKDFFSSSENLKVTKDFPCTCTIQFLKVNGKLDLIVHMRSNDFVWGASAVNIFNYTFMQEYFSRILNLEIGNYYHVVNNFHYYENFKGLLQTLADINHPLDDSYEYGKAFRNLEEFDQMIRLLESYENDIRNRRVSSIIDFGDDFFNDWAKMLYRFNIDKNFNKFTNPILVNLLSHNTDGYTTEQRPTHTAK
ncbi:MAG: thymidylate synthase [Sphingobacteriales bacterium]|nr:MAG: thymidylate synthase [Sphingobacteriales bacterium]